MESRENRPFADTPAPTKLSRAWILVVEDQVDVRRRLLADFEADQIKYSVCDLVRDPMAGDADRVAFTPTLVKRYPAPRMWVLGSLRESDVADMLRVCGVDTKR